MLILQNPTIDIFFKKLLSKADGLPIVCTGSVFKSWHLIKPGFLRCIQAQISRFSSLNSINLVTINGDSTLGAALLASRVYDSSLDDQSLAVNMAQHFNLKSLTTQLDHFSVPSLFNPSPHLHHHHHHHHNHTYHLNHLNHLHAHMANVDLGVNNA